VNRIGRIERATKESTVAVEIDLDGAGKVDISTGVPFYDHMLTAFGVHGAFDLSIKATGDVEIDSHHTVEDVAIVLARRSARHWGSGPVSAASAMPGSRWTNRSRTPPSTCPAGPTACMSASRR
jgi:hypothetical protein